MKDDLGGGAGETKSSSNFGHGESSTESNRIERWNSFLRWTVFLGASGSSVLALLGLLGYVPGFALLGSMSEDYIPMAPSTSISFIVLAGILIAVIYRSPSNKIISLFTALTTIIALFGALEVLGHFTGLDLNFEDALVSSAGYLGEIPIGRMSPSTGATFFLAGLAVLALLLQFRIQSRQIQLGHWAGSLGFLVFGTGLVFCLAYLFGSPLLYGQGATVPMALTTALAFFMLGAATVGASGRDAYPVRLLVVTLQSRKPMSARRRFLALVVIMITASAMVGAAIMLMLYRQDLSGHRNRLTLIVQSQARLIEAIARHDLIYEKNTPGGPTEATMSQIMDAHERYEGFGETGEFTLARFEGNSIVFILRHRNGVNKEPMSVAYQSNLAEPMRRALSGASGTIIGLDYRGETVMAAFEPVAVLKLGIVAKTDMTEIRAPYIRTGLSAVGVTLLVVLVGTMLFFRIGNPLITRLEAYSQDLEREIEEHKQAEEELKENQATLLESQRVGQLGSYSLDIPSGRWTSSDILDEIFGLDNKFVHSFEGWLSIVHPDWQATMTDYFANEVIEKRGRFNKDYQIIRFSDGVERWVHGSGELSFDDEGNPVTMLGTIQDITERQEAEIAIGESEAKYRNLVETSQDLIWSCDSSGCFTYLNPAWETLLGYKIEEMLGKPFADFKPPEIAKRDQETFKKIIRGADMFGYDTIYLTKNGEQRHLVFNAKMVKSSTGDPLGSSGTAHDITERKLAEEELLESNEKLKTSIDNMPNAYILCDPEAIVMEWNGAAEKIFGFSREEIVGQSLVDFIVPENFRHLVVEAINQVKVGEVADYSEKDNNIRKDGKVISCQWFNTPLADDNGRVFALLFMAQDITERREAEEVRARLNAQLKEKNKELEQIVYATSHDLRSPLVNIDGYGKELERAVAEIRSAFDSDKTPAQALKSVAPLLAEDIPNALRFIRISASKMNALLAGLLKLSRFGRATVNIESLDMNDLMNKVAQASEFQIKESGAKLDIADLPSCRGDAVQVNQVFSNLLGNALQYLDPKRTGAVRISGQSKGEQCVYCVEDNGIGIDTAHQQSIFEIFHRLDPAKGEGEGLGLTIIKQILGKLSGEIRVESDPGAGSRFYVTLPSG